MDQLHVTAAVKAPVEAGIVPAGNIEDVVVVVLHRNRKPVSGLQTPSEVASNDRLPEEVVVRDADRDLGLGPDPDPTDAEAVAIHIAEDQACLLSDAVTMNETIPDAVAPVGDEDLEALRRTILAAVVIAPDRGLDRYCVQVDRVHTLRHALRPELGIYHTPSSAVQRCRQKGKSFTWDVWNQRSNGRILSASLFNMVA